ncbi:MAG: hypothetical protein IT178_16085 [Acidobacteria bacterium]|nr:hypothetical protein [Acidobacteriota bacterium]
MWAHFMSLAMDDGIPEVPAGTRTLLLARPGSDTARWGVFAVDRPVSVSPHAHPLSDEALKLIASAFRYPPALALARDDVDALFDRRTPGMDEFVTRYVECLQRHVRAAAEVPFVFAEAVADKNGAPSRGQFYWVLSYSALNRSVQWVSADFTVFENAVSDFKLSPQQLAALGRPRAK